ncbi:MAG: hypothetical protein IJF84_08815 [Thermoguttaceae bacterium]|nr:hypothetical protein [Thermoguttaceae bacterium]
MHNAIKKKIVAVAAVTILAFQFVVQSCSPVYSCFSQNPKQLFYAICFHLKHDSDKSFCGKINSVVASIQGYVSLKPLSSAVNFEKDVNMCWIDVYALCAKYQGLYRLHHTKDCIVRLLNGSLSVCSDYSDMVSASQNLLSCEEFLNERGISMLYVIAPHKNYKYHPLTPRGIIDYETGNMNRLVSQIKDRIDVIDNRELYKNNPEEHYKLFYIGDSHWKIQYAFLAYCQIMQYLEERYSIEFENKLKSIENFSVYSSGVSDDLSELYGRFYLPKESTLYLKPKFFTNIKIFSSNNVNLPFIYDVDYTGDFDMTILCKLYPTLKVVNPEAVNKKKLMVIGDSFSPPVMSLLCLSFEQVEFHAFNYYRDSLIKNIEEFQPDCVLCIFSSRQTELPIFKEFSK